MMKEYTEILTNPNTNTIQEVKVREFFADDLINTKSPTLSRAPKQIKKGDLWLEDNVERITAKEYGIYWERYQNEILPQLKREYNRSVSYFTDRYISEFKKIQSESREGDNFYILANLEYCEWLMFPTKELNPKLNELNIVNYTLFRGRNTRDLYKRVIKGNERDYGRIIIDWDERLFSHIGIDAAFQFYKYLKELLKRKTAKTNAISKPKPKTDFDKTLESIKKEGNKFHKGIPMEFVVEHFKPLTTELSKNEKPFLTEPQLSKFLQRAFLGRTDIEKQKINFSRGDKGFVILRFYQFFSIATEKYHVTKLKADFIGLILDNLSTEWNRKNVTVFFKSDKTKRKW